MATHADITACLGETAATYATNKHTGGNNGNKCGAFGALMMANINSPDGAHVEDLLSNASRFYPSTVRLFPAAENWQERLRLDFTEILARIPGLLYSADRGFFRWSGFGTSGVFGSSVLSEEFIAFQEEVVRTPPKTFEDFERVLP